MQKAEAELTDEDRKRLVMMGFGKSDDELTEMEKFRLKLYKLEEARRAWRRQHPPLPKEIPLPAEAEAHEP